jgi:thioredoxin-related protein
MKKTVLVAAASAVVAALIGVLAYSLAPGRGGAQATGGASDRDSLILAASERSARAGTQAPAPLPNKPEALTLHSLDEALGMAQRDGKFVLVYFWTSWCPNCEIFNREVLTDPAVLDSLLKSYVFVSIDGDDDRDRLGRAFRVRGYPTIYILDKEQDPALVIPGRIPADTFAHVLTYISTGAHESMEFDEYEAALAPAPATPPPGGPGAAPGRAPGASEG